MKKILPLAIAAAIIASCRSSKETELKPMLSDTGNIAGHRKLYTDSTLIIGFDEKTGKAPLLEAIKENNCKIIYDYNNFSFLAIKIGAGMDILKAMEYFRSVEGVVSVERDHIYYIDDPKPRIPYGTKSRQHEQLQE